MRQSVRLLIVFIDLTRYKWQADRVDDAALADVIDDFYERVADAVASVGGTTVKFIGDAALAVFADDTTDAAVRMTIALRRDVDEWMTSLGWPCRLNARIHIGTVIAGEYGPAADRRFDVIGRAVNAAAMLPWGGVTLSPEAYSALSRDVSEFFKKGPAGDSYVAV